MTSTRGALPALGLAVLLASFASSSANVALPALAGAFGASFEEVQRVVLAYLVAVTALLGVAGGLGDRLGRRRLVLLGLSLFTAASLLCGLAPDLRLLVAARALQGLGAAAVLALTTALALDVAGGARAGRALGLVGSASAVGTALGPGLGGLLVAWLGWRAPFLALVPAGVAALVVARRTLPPDAPTSAGRSARAPLVGARAALGSSALAAAVVMATLVVGPFHLGRALGLAPASVGLLLAVGPVVAALAGVPAGRLVDRRGAGPMSLAGLAGMVAATAALALLPARLGPAAWLLPIALLTAGNALFQAANGAAVMAGRSPEQRGALSGLLALSRSLGFVAGAWALGALFARAAGADDVAVASPEAVAGATRATFAAATLLLLLGLAASLRSRAGDPLRVGEARTRRTPTLPSPAVVLGDRRVVSPFLRGRIV